MSASNDSLNEIQAQILAEDLSDNELLRHHVLIEKNSKLNTGSQTVIGAINEVLRKTKSVGSTNKAALAELYNVLGHVGIQPELTQKVLKEAPSLIQLVLDMLGRINAADATRNIVQKDKFEVGEIPQAVFDLEHTPIAGLVIMTINGVVYYDGYEYDSNNNRVTWLFDSTEGGFDIYDSEVVIEYTYDAKKEEEEAKNNG